MALRPAPADPALAAPGVPQPGDHQDGSRHRGERRRGVGEVGPRQPEQDLHLQRALAEAKLQDLCYMGLHFCFQDDILAGYTEIDVTLADEGWDVGRR